MALKTTLSRFRKKKAESEYAAIIFQTALFGKMKMSEMKEKSNDLGELEKLIPIIHAELDKKDPDSKYRTVIVKKVDGIWKDIVRSLGDTSVEIDLSSY